MGYLVYLVFVVIYVGEYVFKKIGLTSKMFAILPEMMSILVGIFVLLHFALYRKIKMQPRYLFFYFAFAVHVAIGLIGNHVQPLAVLSGLRIYFKFLPFYFLPMIYDIPDDQIKGHLKALLAVAVLQLPLTVYQRGVEYSEFSTGDVITGTLTSAPFLTVFLVCTISVLIGFYLKKRIGINLFVFLVAMAFLPTAINETKATVILLPLAILMPTIFGVGRASRLKIIATVIPALVLMIIGFHYFYKTMYADRSDVIEFYTSDKASEYLYKGAEAEQVIGGREDEVGRMDAIVYAYEENSKDFFRLVWGVGIGNASISFSKKFMGDYSGEYERLGGRLNGLAHFIWEIGLLGIVYIVWFLMMVVSDAMKLKEKEDVSGPIALGWMGVATVLAASMPYQNLITNNEIVYAFFYISGFLAAKRYILEKEETELPRIEA